ncbi:MAG: Mur ligase family protein [Collinsella intestinalis]
MTVYEGLLRPPLSDRLEAAASLSSTAPRRSPEDSIFTSRARGYPSSASFPQRAASSQIMGEPEFAWLLSPERWCAITGTNGKTTVTSLTDELLRLGARYVAVGNIGNAPIHEVDRREGEWFVAELSSYQLATTEAFHPCVAVLLNLRPIISPGIVA